MNKTAVITGVSSGIGQAIASKLLKLNINVIGISRREVDFKEAHFTHYVCDLLDVKTLTSTCKEILSTCKVDYLVNSAGIGLFSPHEELHVEDISSLLDVNLKAPIILSNQLLRSLKQTEGTIINISSIEALRSAKFSALYSASKAGLRAFSLSLYEEVRKSGVNVVVINPDMTDTAFFDELHFGVSSKDDEKLFAEDIANLVEDILHTREGVSINEITLRAKRFGIAKKKRQTS